MFHQTMSLLCSGPSEVPSHAGKEPSPPGGLQVLFLLVPPLAGFATFCHTCPAPAHVTIMHRWFLPFTGISRPGHLRAHSLAASGVYLSATTSARPSLTTISVTASFL